MYTAAVKKTVTAEDVEYDPAVGYPPGTDNVQEALDFLITGGGGGAPMTPTVEGTAYGSTDQLGRTMLGYQVDDSSSNSIKLWSSASGLSQGVHNSTSSVTAFTDTLLTGANLQNGVYLGDAGSLQNTNANNSILIERGSLLANVPNLQRNILIGRELTLDPTDAISDSVVIASGEFVSHPSRFNECVLIGSVDQAFGALTSAAIYIAPPGAVAIQGIANNSLYIGNGQQGYLAAAGDARLADFNRFFVNTLRLSPAAEVVYYDALTGEMTRGAPPAAVVPLMEPNVPGTSFGITNVAQSAEVQGRTNFQNYTGLGATSLVQTTAMGSFLYANSLPATTTFTTNVLLGYNHIYDNAVAIQNCSIIANSIGTPAITGLSSCNIHVPRDSGFVTSYAGFIRGLAAFSSGTVSSSAEPRDSLVLGSSGTYSPGANNLLIGANVDTGLLAVSGNGNTLISASNTAITYTMAGVSNSTVIRNGTGALNPTANQQLASNHTSLYMPALAATAAPTATSWPAVYDPGTGRVSWLQSNDFSRVLRRQGTTNGAGQAVFNTGIFSPLAAGVALNATAAGPGTAARIAMITTIGGSSVTVTVFESVLAVVGSPTMVAVGSGVTVYFTMAY